MSKKVKVIVFVSGLLLMGLVLLSIYQPAQISAPAAAQGSDASLYEAFSCPARWDDEGGYFAVESGVQADEAGANVQNLWGSKEASYLRL